MTAAVPEKLKGFFRDYALREYRKGEIILRADDGSPGIFYLKSGYVRMYQIFENGKELTLNIFKPGTYFPVICLFSTLENKYYFEAMTLVSTHMAPKEKVLMFLKSDLEVLMELIDRLVVGFSGIITNTELLLSAKACQRIMSMLSILAGRFGKVIGGNAVLITLSLSHEDIARLVNLTRETTSVEMKKLMDEKLIYYERRHITINNLPVLESRLHA